MRKVALIGLLILLAVISSGCVGESQQIYVCQSGDTVSNPDLCPKETLTPAPTTPAPETTQPHATPITINPKFYVLTLDDIGSDYLVTESKYNNLDTLLDEGVEIEYYNDLKDSGYVEDYLVKFSNFDKNIFLIENLVLRYNSKSDLEKRLEYYKELYSNLEDPKVLVGREFGDDSIYVTSMFKSSVLGTDYYYQDILLHFSKENYKVNIKIMGLRGDLKASDLYPYAEILEKRISSNEQIIPPTILPQTTTPPTTTPAPSTPSPLGASRSNPAQLSDTLTIKFKDYSGGEYELKVSVLEVRRGDEAMALLNQHYADEYKSGTIKPPSPKEGHEYLITKIKFDYLGGPTPDKKYNLDEYEFDLVSSQGKVYDNPIIETPTPELDSVLYPGASNEGWAVYEIEISDEKPLITFKSDYDFRDEEYWFKLYP